MSQLHDQIRFSLYSVSPIEKQCFTIKSKTINKYLIPLNQFKESPQQLRINKTSQAQKINFPYFEKSVGLRSKTEDSTSEDFFSCRALSPVQKNSMPIKSPHENQKLIQIKRMYRYSDKKSNMKSECGVKVVDKELSVIMNKVRNMIKNWQTKEKNYLEREKALKQEIQLLKQQSTNE